MHTIRLKKTCIATLCMLVVCFSPNAYGAFLFCNQTKTAIEAAFGHKDRDAWVSQGWWLIQPGQCARVYGKPLDQRFYFYFARPLTLSAQENKGLKLWSGRYAFCVNERAFRIEGDRDCEKRSFRTQGFHEVDVGLDQTDYTLNFQDTDER